MAQSRTDFIAGKMNKTVDERLVPPGEYVDALNVRLGSTEGTEIGAVENSKGNTLLADVQYAGDTLSPAARTIGVYEDGVNETLYWFINDPNNTNSAVTGRVDLIVSYNTDTSTLVYHVISTSVLNFDKEFLITGVSKIENLLFFTDDLNPPRVINVQKSPPGYGLPTIGHIDTLVEEDISVIVKPPGYEYYDPTTQVAPLGTPHVELLEIQPPAQSNPLFPNAITTGGEENYIRTRFLSFAYRYRYEDGGYSAISLFSLPAFQPETFQFSIQNYLNAGMFNRYNACNVTFSTGPKQVVEVDLLYKQTTSNVIYVIKRYNKADEGWSNNDFQTILFDNSEIYTTLGSDELLRLYDNVPRIAKAQTIQGNRLVYGNFVDGYDIKDAPGGNEIRIVYNTQPFSEDIAGETIGDGGATNPVLSTLPYTIEGVTVTGQDSVLTWDLSPANIVGGIPIGTVFNFRFEIATTTSIASGYTQQSPFNISMTFTVSVPGGYADVTSMCASPEFRNRIGGSLVQNQGTMADLYPCNDSDSGATLSDKFYGEAQPLITGTAFELINGGRDLADACPPPAPFPAPCASTIIYQGVTSCGPAPNTIVCTPSFLTDDTAGLDFTTLGLISGTDIVKDNTTGFTAVIGAVTANTLGIINSIPADDAVGLLEVSGANYQIFSGAASTASCSPQGFDYTPLPDGFSIALPATQYYDGTTSEYIYYYFVAYGCTAGYFLTADQGSLHSNRDYETGIVYMDDQGRASTVLVSNNNTTFFDPSTSVYKNKIKVTLDNQPPYWATKYKFVVKPSEGTYYTIFSNIFYPQDGTGKDPSSVANENDPSLVWFKLDGNNQNLVKVGDELIVKVDTAGAVLDEERATVLAVESFSSKGITKNSLKGLYMLLKPGGWTIESTQQNYYKGAKNKDAKDSKGSNRYSSGCIPNYSLNEDEAVSPIVPYDIPVGSSIRIKISNWRGGGGGDCDSKKLKYDKSFVSTTDYPNFHAWAVGDDLQSQMNKVNASTAYEMDIKFNPVLAVATTTTFTGVPWLPPITTTSSNACVNNPFMAVCSVAQSPSGGMYFVNSCGIPRCWEWTEYYNGHCQTLIEVTRGGSLLVWETVPLDADPNLFYDASDLLEIKSATPGGTRNHMADRTFVPGTNTYTFDSGGQDQVFPNVPLITNLDFINCFTFGNGIESFRINDNPAGKTFNLGERVLAVSNQDFKEADRFAGMTYSGVYSDSNNSNNLNEFNLGLVNFKDLETSFGPIQILHSRETDILVLQEDRISYVLSKKNVITDSTGGGAIASVPQVLGTQVARIEEFGISFNPESFAVWGEQMFFTDAKRGSVINLVGASQNSDQLQIVSRYGMNSWFRDRFNATLTSQKLGAYDPYMNEYVLTINNESVPRPKSKLPCGTTISQLGNSGTLTYDVDLGLNIGDINIPYTITSGSITINVTWNGVVYSSGVLTPASTSTFSFAKTTNTPKIAEVEIVASVASTYEIQVECAPEIPVTIIQVVVNSPNYNTQTIHTNYNWTDGSYISPFTGISPSILVVPQPSEYQSNTGVRGIGNYPKDSSDITLRTQQILPDNFNFDPNLHKLKILSSNTLYTNSTVDINALLAASSVAGGGVYTNPSAGIFQATETAFSMPLGNQYVYLVWEFVFENSQTVCYCSSSAIDACCDCTLPCETAYFSPITSNISQVCSVDSNSPGNLGQLGFNGTGSIPTIGDIVFDSSDCTSGDYLVNGFYVVTPGVTTIVPKNWIQVGVNGEVIGSGICP
jgi:hypothetical protein